MGKSRFVLLEHFQAEGSHFDLLFEDGDRLLTWRLPRLPTTGEQLEVEKSFDHRLMYLDYEGPISGDRGHVVRRDAGTYERLVWGGSLIQVRVQGERLRGELRLLAPTVREGSAPEGNPSLTVRASNWSSLWMLKYDPGEE